MGSPLAVSVGRHLLRKNGARLGKRLRLRRTLPWMAPREVELLQELLDGLRPRRCLEWGAGGSTLRLGRRLPPDATWLTIEHDAAWAELIRERNRRSGTRVLQVERGERYLDSPRGEAPFDFILVDGRDRVACLRRAAGWLAPDGVLVLHDANRERYRSGLPALPHTALFQDRRGEARRPYGGLWLGSRRPLETLIDVPRHRAVWRFYNGLGRFLGC